MSSDHQDTCGPRRTERAAISVVMPFYKRFSEFSRVFPLNLPYFERWSCQIVLALDEPSEELQVVQFVRAHPTVRWSVLVNDRAHAWRPPCRALNVGIRHAAGDYVLIVSPESAFASDLIGCALARLRASARAAVAGQVRFGTFSGLVEHGSDVERAFEAAILDQQPRVAPAVSSALAGAPGARPSPTAWKWFYGSLLIRRDELVAIHGYDEELEGWGGDDDNLRVRLRRNGVRVLAEPDMKVLHLSDEPRAPRRMQATGEYRRRVLMPRMPIANGEDWGMDFGRRALE